MRDALKNVNMKRLSDNGRRWRSAPNRIETEDDFPKKAQDEHEMVNSGKYRNPI